MSFRHSKEELNICSRNLFVAPDDVLHHLDHEALLSVVVVVLWELMSPPRVY